MIGESLTVLRDGLLSLLFPPRCECCGVLQETLLCAACRQQFAPVRPPLCRVCGLPFDPLAKSPELCAECFGEQPSFDAARAAGIYSGVLRRGIQRFKFDGVRAFAVPLAAFIAETVQLPFPVECLCPVPLHPARERRRGYNQSLLLARELAEYWQLPLAPNLLSRIIDTRPQLQLPAAERRNNVRGAFVAEKIAGQDIALIDDVFTTGSTLRECSKTLKAAGARRVMVVTVARVVLQV